ncbi:6396_t:CDS:2, partial [Gigaspora rosea]
MVIPHIQYVYGAGPGQDQQQKLTNLKIDRCNKLIQLEFNDPPFSKISVGENKQLIADRNRLKSQVEKLTSAIRNIKGFNPDYRLWLDILLETQQEILQNDNTFARKQL